jgi:dihydroorotase
MCQNVWINNVVVADPRSVWNGQKVALLLNNNSIGEILPAEKLTGEALDWEGCMVSPGWIACAVFCPEPGHELRDSLANVIKASLQNGFTDVIFYPNSALPFDQPNQLPNHFDTVRFHFAGALSEGLTGKDMSPMGELHQAGAIAFTDGFTFGTEEGLLLRTLDYARLFGKPIIVLPLEKKLAFGGVANQSPFTTALGLKGIPNVAETIYLTKALHLLEYIGGGRLHFSPITTKEGVEIIREAKSKGLPVTADTALPYIAYTDNCLHDFNSVYKVLPPLRTEADRLALIEGLKDGTLDFLSAHHQPLTLEEKQVEWDDADAGMMTLQAFGAVAYQALVVENQMPVTRFAELLTHGIMDTFGLAEKSIAVGANNITFFHPEREWSLDRVSLHSRSINHPLLNQMIKGKVVGVLTPTGWHTY